MKNRILRTTLILAGIASLTGCDSYQIIDAKTANTIVKNYIDIYNTKLEHYFPNNFNIKNESSMSYKTTNENGEIEEGKKESTIVANFSAEQKFAYIGGTALDETKFNIWFYQGLGAELNNAYYVVCEYTNSKEDGGEQFKYYGTFDAKDSELLSNCIRYVKKATVYYTNYYMDALNLLLNLLSFTTDTFAEDNTTTSSKASTTFKTCGDGSLRTKVEVYGSTSNHTLKYKTFSSFENYLLVNSIYRKQVDYVETINHEKVDVREIYESSLTLNENIVDTSKIKKPNIDESFEEIDVEEMIENSHFFAKSED